jgi:acetylornithine deacetylase
MSRTAIVGAATMITGKEKLEKPSHSCCCPSQTDELLQSILAERLSLFSTLVRTPSTRGREETAQMLLMKEWHLSGLKTERIETLRETHHKDVTSAPSIVAIWRGTGGGRSLILNSHMDIAPPGPRELWHRDPFSGDIENGFIYGRGSWDDKAGAIAILMTLDFLKRSGISLSGDLILQSVVEDEFSGCGTQSLIKKGIKADAAIIVDGHYGNRLAHGHPGHLEFKIIVYGKPAPSCRVETGTSAILKAFELIGCLQEWSKALLINDDPSWEKACEGSLINIGRISGGEWVGTVPQKCTFDCLVRFAPPLSIQDVKASLVLLLDKVGQSDPWLAESPPHVEYGDLSLEPVLVETDGIFFTVVKDAIAHVMNKPAEAHICPGWCDIRHFYAETGIPAYLFGPGRGQGAHRPDECFETAQLIPHVKVLLEIVRQWCTDEKESWVSL